MRQRLKWPLTSGITSHHCVQPGLSPASGSFPAIDCFRTSPTFGVSFVLSTVWSHIFAVKCLQCFALEETAFQR